MPMERFQLDRTKDKITYYHIQLTDNLVINHRTVVESP